MSEDQQQAGRIVANWMVNFSYDQPDALANMIATALADEREKARAQLASDLADRYWRDTSILRTPDIRDWIRRAAEAGQ